MNQVPNILTILRIALAPIFVLMYLQPEFVWRSLSIAVFAVAAITDYFDGYLARYYQVESDSGIFMDPLADKILTFSGFICLPFIAPEQFPWWAILVILMRDIFVTIMRIWAENSGTTMKTRYMAKVKTFTQMIYLYIAILVGVFIKTDITVGDYSRWLLDSHILEWSLYIIVIITVYSGLEYIYYNKQLFRRT